MHGRIVRLILLAACLSVPLQASRAAGQQPQIVGPAASAVYQMVALQVQGAPDGSQFAWACAQQGATLIDFSGETKVVFQAQTTGSYDVILFAAVLGTGNKFTLYTVHHTVTVGTTPGPNPPTPIPPTPIPPTPPSPVVPVLPDGKYGLAKAVYGWAMAVDPTARPLAKGMAANFSTIAAQIAAGTIKTPNDAATATKALNTATLGSFQPLWSTVSKNLETQMNAIGKAGQFATMTDLQTAWQEIAAGLQAVQ